MTELTIRFIFTLIAIIAIIGCCILLVEFIHWLTMPKCKGKVERPKPWGKPPCKHRYVRIVPGTKTETKEGSRYCGSRMVCVDCGEDVTDIIHSTGRCVIPKKISDKDIQKTQKEILELLEKGDSK